MFPQTDKSWHDYRALNQNWSYQRTLAGHAIITTEVRTLKIETPRIITISALKMESFYSAQMHSEDICRWKANSGDPNLTAPLEAV